MKNQVVIIALIAVLFILVAGSILASFTFYKEYKDKVEYLEQQTQVGKSRVEGVEAKMDGFKSSVDEINSQLKTYTENLKAVQNTVVLSEEERKALLAKVEEMKKDLQDWQKEYSSSVIDIRQSVLTLRDTLDKIDNKSRQVELGKITVKQQAAQKDAPAKDAPKDTAKEPEKKKATGSNFKSGNVRKASSF